MRETKYFVFLVVISLLILPVSIALADEPEKIDKIIVSGVGVDVDKAKQNAIRNAVEQVIGIYVSSDTIVQNNTLLNDEVLSYSGGYVKDFKIIAQGKNDGGLYSIKIEANVVSTKLKRKLESLNIATKKVEGESLFGEAISKIENQQSGQALLDKILSKYPQAAYVFEIGKPQIQSTDPSTGRAKVRIPIAIQWDQKFLGELKDILSKVATAEFKSTDMRAVWNGQYRIGHKVACFSSMRTITSGRADVCEALGIIGERSNIEPSNGTKLSFKSTSIFNLPVSARAMSLSLKFKDKSGTDVYASTYIFKDNDDSDSGKKHGVLFIRDAAGFTYPLMGMPGFLPPNIIDRGMYSSDQHILILTDGIFKLSPEVSIDISILKDITKVEVSIDPWQK